LVSVEVGPQELAAFERLALLERNERDKRAVASAVMQFLAAAAPVAAVGDAIWPADDDED
jgi:hypothetical protein